MDQVPRVVRRGHLVQGQRLPQPHQARPDRGGHHPQRELAHLRGRLERRRVVDEDVLPVHGRGVQHQGRDALAVRGADRGAQRDAAAHRPAHQHDPARAVCDGVVDRGLGVLPLGGSQMMHPVRGGRGAHVVAIGDGQARQPQPVQQRDDPQRLAAGGAVAVDEDRPGVLVARGGAERGLGAHEPGRHVAHGGFDRDLRGGQAVRGLRGAGPVEAVARGPRDLQRLLGVDGEHGAGDRGRGGPAVHGAQAHVHGAAALTQREQPVAAGGARVVEVDAVGVDRAHRDVGAPAQALPGHQRQPGHHPGADGEQACAEREHRDRADGPVHRDLRPSSQVRAVRARQGATQHAAAGTGRGRVARHTRHPNGELRSRL